MIARVVVDSPLPHLDRAFDYAIPPALEGVAPGTRVRVPFAGRLTSGIVVDVSDGESDFSLKSLKSAAALPSFSASGWGLVTSIAHRYGGGAWDVARLVAPARVASVEKLQWEAWTRRGIDAPPALELAARSRTAGLPTRPGERAVWAASPTGGEPVPADLIVGAAIASVADGGSALVVAPDARAVATLVDAARRAGLARWTARHGGHVAVLDADDGPAVRYGSYLAAMRGLAPLVIGTRQTAWQPVDDLRLIAVWDEASSTMQEPRAPYPHARTVAAMRSQESGCALLVAGRALSADAIALVEHGFAARLEHDPDRSRRPAVEIIGDARRDSEGGSGRHWMPGAVWAPLLAAARDGVAAILVPQAGYASGLACARCGTWAECPACGGDLASSGPQAVPRCRDCGTEAPAWHCPECRGYRLRPVGLGVARLAEQVRRMASGVPVTESSAEAGVRADHEVSTGLVVATPGALPAVTGGYGALTIVGARVNVAEGLGAELASYRRWAHAAALVRSRADGGTVYMVGELPPDVRTALVAGDGWAVGERDLAQRVALGLPPHRRAMRLDGDAEGVDEVVRAISHAGADVARDADGAWVLASRAAMQGIVTAARAVVVARSGRSATPVFLRVDAVPGQRTRPAS